MADLRLPWRQSGACGGPTADGGTGAQPVGRNLIGHTRENSRFAAPGIV